MSDSTGEPSSNQVFNIPNQITMARLALAMLVFVLIAWQLYMAALIAFIIAAGTDWCDGFWARRYNQVTKLGRILDPFADKIIICGVFVFLVAEPESGVEAWMAVVVIAREMAVTVLRSFIEQSGGDFSAKWSGKLKMVFQCVAVGASLLTLAWGGASAPDWLQWTLFVALWVAVISTIESGVSYAIAAGKYFRV
jgi:CDP-diacylglycerol--glycerol-3-phosphate 3-phosphatidyltransferase